MALGITKFEKGNNGSVILGCEIEENLKLLSWIKILKLQSQRK